MKDLKLSKTSPESVFIKNSYKYFFFLVKQMVLNGYVDG
jgi:hypothetical protein